MLVLKKVFSSFIAIILFASILFIGNLYLNIIGSFILSTLLMITLILFILTAIVFLFKQKRQPSTNIIIIVLSVMLIPIAQLLPVGNALIYLYHPFLSDGEMTLTKKIGYAEMLLTGHISSDVLLEDYRKETRGNVTFYMPDDADYDKWMDIVSQVQAEKREYRNNLWEETLSDEVKIVFTEDFGPDLNNMVGRYHIIDQSVYLKIPQTAEEAQYFRSTVLHEITHLDYYVAAKSRGVDAEKLPMWFTEGVASFMDSFYIITDLIEFEDVEWVPFEELERADQWALKNTAPYHPYLQSRQFIQELVNRKGIEVLMDIIIESNQISFYGAFEKEIGTTVEAFGQEVKSMAEAMEYDFYHLDRQELLQDQTRLKEMQSFVPKLNEVNHELARSFMELGQYDKAAEIYGSLVQTGMASYITHTNLVLLYVMLEKWEEAEKVIADYEYHTDSEMLKHLEDSYISMKKMIDSNNPIEGYIYFIENTTNWSFQTKQLLIDQLLEKPENMEPEEREKLLKLKTVK